MTGSQFLAYVKKIFRRSDKDDEIYEATTDIVVDMRLRLLSDDYSTISSDLASGLSAGSYTLDAPSTLGHILTDGVLIRNTSSDETYYPLKKISKELYDEIYHENYSSTASKRVTGVPRHYAYFGRRIYLGPAVDHANYEFKINYTTSGVTDITSSTDPVPFTDKYRRILRDGVCSLMYKQLENFAEADKFEIDYEQGLVKISANDEFNYMDNSAMRYNAF